VGWKKYHGEECYSKHPHRIKSAYCHPYPHHAAEVSKTTTSFVVSVTYLFTYYSIGAMKQTNLGARGKDESVSPLIQAVPV